jgi:hypothetical protein
MHILPKMVSRANLLLKSATPCLSFKDYLLCAERTVDNPLKKLKKHTRILLAQGESARE